jgi:hypothetical protein
MWITNWIPGVELTARYPTFYFTLFYNGSYRTLWISAKCKLWFKFHNHTSSLIFNCRYMILFNSEWYIQNFVLKWVFLKVKSDIDEVKSSETETQFPELKPLADIIPSKFALEFQLHVSMKFWIIHRELWAEMNVSLK